MSATPCATCRHYTIHLRKLGAAIANLRIAATTHPGLHERLMNHVEVGRRIRTKRDTCREQHQPTAMEEAKAA